MGILSRFSDIVGANVNALLDKLEDPSKMVDKYLQDAREDLAKVKKETAGIMAAEKARKRERDNLQSQVNEYQELARKAVAAGNDGDAKHFIAKKQELEADLAKAEANYTTAHQQSQQIIQMHDKLVSDIQELERRKANVKATQAVADTQETLNRAAGISGKSADVRGAFDRMEQKAQEQLDRAQAAAELDMASQPAEDDIKAKYAAGGSKSVDDELAALKAEMGVAQE